jgi:hypothetical protein
MIPTNKNARFARAFLLTLRIADSAVITGKLNDGISIYFSAIYRLQNVRKGLTTILLMQADSG